MSHNPFAPSSAGGATTHIRHPLGDRFIVLKELGRGTSGVVTLCRRKSDWQLFAIKEIYIGQDVDERRRIYAEAKLMMNIPAHPSIVRLEEVAESRDSVFLVLEYVPEGSIYNLVYPASIQKEREERKEKRIAEKRREKKQAPRRRKSREDNDGGEVVSQTGSAGVNGVYSLAHVYGHRKQSDSNDVFHYQPPGAVSSTFSNNLARDVATPSVPVFNGPALDVNCFSPSTPGAYSEMKMRHGQRKNTAVTSGADSGAVDSVNTTTVTDFFYDNHGVQRLDGGDFGDAESDGYYESQNGSDEDMSSGNSDCEGEGADFFMNEERVVKWFSQLANAVEFLHAQGVAHRDIKLDNILVCSGQTVVKICDFGVATSVGRAATAGVQNTSRLFTSMTITNALGGVGGSGNIASQAMLEHTTVGTPQYMAPEICDGRPHSLQCDVWSLGVSFYEICARRLPFDASNMLALMHKVIENPAKPLPAVYSPRLSAMILSMLAKDPRRRPTMKQVVQMFAHYRKSKAIFEELKYEIMLKMPHKPNGELLYESDIRKIEGLKDTLDDLGIPNFRAAPQPPKAKSLREFYEKRPSSAELWAQTPIRKKNRNESANDLSGADWATVGSAGVVKNPIQDDIILESSTRDPSNDAGTGGADASGDHTLVTSFREEPDDSPSGGQEIKITGKAMLPPPPLPPSKNGGKGMNRRRSEVGSTSPVAGEHGYQHTGLSRKGEEPLTQIKKLDRDHPNAVLSESGNSHSTSPLPVPSGRRKRNEDWGAADSGIQDRWVSSSDEGEPAAELDNNKRSGDKSDRASKVYEAQKNSAGSSSANSYRTSSSSSSDSSRATFSNSPIPISPPPKHSTGKPPLPHALPVHHHLGLSAPTRDLSNVDWLSDVGSVSGTQFHFEQKVSIAEAIKQKVDTTPTLWALSPVEGIPKVEAIPESTASAGQPPSRASSTPSGVSPSAKPLPLNPNRVRKIFAGTNPDEMVAIRDDMNNNNGGAISEGLSAYLSVKGNRKNSKPDLLRRGSTDSGTKGNNAHGRPIESGSTMPTDFVNPLKGINSNTDLSLSSPAAVGKHKETRARRSGTSLSFQDQSHSPPTTKQTMVGIDLVSDGKREQLTVATQDASKSTNVSSYGSPAPRTAPEKAKRHNSKRTEFNVTSGPNSNQYNNNLNPKLEHKAPMAGRRAQHPTTDPGLDQGNDPYATSVGLPSTGGPAGRAQPGSRVGNIELNLNRRQRSNSGIASSTPVDSNILPQIPLSGRRAFVSEEDESTIVRASLVTPLENIIRSGQKSKPLRTEPLNIINPIIVVPLSMAASQATPSFLLESPSASKGGISPYVFNNANIVDTSGMLGGAASGSPQYEGNQSLSFLKDSTDSTSSDEELITGTQAKVSKEIPVPLQNTNTSLNATTHTVHLHNTELAKFLGGTVTVIDTKTSGGSPSIGSDLISASTQAHSSQRHGSAGRRHRQLIEQSHQQTDEHTTTSEPGNSTPNTILSSNNSKRSPFAHPTPPFAPKSNGGSSGLLVSPPLALLDQTNDGPYLRQFSSGKDVGMTTFNSNSSNSVPVGIREPSPPMGGRVGVPRPPTGSHPPGPHSRQHSYANSSVRSYSGSVGVPEVGPPVASGSPITRFTNELKTHSNVPLSDGLEEATTPADDKIINHNISGSSSRTNSTCQTTGVNSNMPTPTRKILVGARGEADASSDGNNNIRYQPQPPASTLYEVPQLSTAHLSTQIKTPNRNYKTQPIRTDDVRASEGKESAQNHLLFAVSPLTPAAIPTLDATPIAARSQSSTPNCMRPLFQGNGNQPTFGGESPVPKVAPAATVLGTGVSITGLTASSGTGVRQTTVIQPAIISETSVYDIDDVMIVAGTDDSGLTPAPKHPEEKTVDNRKHTTEDDSAKRTKASQPPANVVPPGGSKTPPPTTPEKKEKDTCTIM